MFRSRKRKVSPDKKPDKAKKLKVSSKIFRSPSSTKTNSEAKAKVSKLLPEGYDSIILTASTKPVESFEENEAVFGCVRLPIHTKEDAMVWVKKFERKTYTTYRTQKTWKKDVNTGLFKRKYICNVRNKDATGQPSTPTCKGSIIFTIKDQEEIQANPDYYLRDYPSQVIIHFCHNHRIDPDSYMKNLRPSAELRIIFGTYFAKGHSPFSALICHKCDLHSSYGADFYNVVSNGAICPSYNWCFHEYEKFFMRKFIEPPDEKLFEKLRDMVSQYNAKWRSECAIISYCPMFVLTICTPLMKSIFRSGFAEELITVRCFSTPKTVPKRQKLILFLCHTPIGSLPFGVVVTFAEDTENICEGIRTLIKMFGVISYSPKIIITDENASASKALKRCFPNAQVLFNEFQMLQSIWRIIRVVCANDDEEFQALYNLFLVTLNSSTEEEFKKNFDSLLVYAEKYPKLTNFLKYFKLRSNSYVLYARPKIEFNTEVLNYTDSGTVILQDVSIKYGNFFNIVQLFDFLSKSYVDHYERKLNKIVEGDLKGFFKTNFYVPLSKIADFTCEKISDTEFLVSLNEMKFFVTAELDTCTCQVGIHGGSCVHQYIVEKNLGLVPECYTPLCEDMVEIFKNILREKNIKPPLPDNDHLSEIGSTLDTLKSELETPNPDDFSDMMSSVCCSEISNFSGMPHDMDHLGPLDEIFLVPPDVNDSFTDITDEIMSPLVLSEFDDTNEENEDFLNDSEEYNKESGELEPIPSSSSQEAKNFQNNVFVEVLPTNLEQSTGVFSDQTNEGNMIIYEYTEEEVKCNNEKGIVELGGEGNTMVHLPTEGTIVLSANIEEYNITENVTEDVESPVVYTYSGENQDQVEFYEELMSENDRKTAEIAEFLTNLPDTNNSHPIVIAENNNDRCENINPTDYVVDKEGLATNKGLPTSSNGVVVMKNEEYFTNYQVLENNVLSVVPEDKDAFADNITENISNQGDYDRQHSGENIISDTYEDNNLIMMSPNDLFDDNQNVEPDMSTDKQDVRINVLSSVVIKPPVVYTSAIPLNLNAIKHKTLRKVKEDRRINKSENTVFVHDPERSEPRKIVLPIIIKKDSNQGISTIESKDNNVNYSNQIYEKDVIKLYCNQSGEKLSSDNKERKETKTASQELVLSKVLEGVSKADNVEQERPLQQLNTQNLTQSEEYSQKYEKEIENFEDTVLVELKIRDQEVNKRFSNTKIDLQDYEEGISESEEITSEDYSQSNENLLDSEKHFRGYEMEVLDSEEITLVESEDHFQEPYQKISSSKVKLKDIPHEHSQNSNKKLSDYEVSFHRNKKNSISELNKMEVHFQRHNQESCENFPKTELILQEYEKEVSNFKEITINEVKDNSATHDQDIVERSEEDILEEYTLPDCDAEELAKNESIEIVEIDSDGLEELASKNYDSSLLFTETSLKPTNLLAFSSEKSPLKVTPLEHIPSNVLPFKPLPRGRVSSSVCIPLKDFISKTAPTKTPVHKQLPCEEKALIDKNFSEKVLQEKLTTTFSHLENLLGRDSFKESVEKFLGKKTYDDGSNKYSGQLQNETGEVIDKMKKMSNTITLQSINNPTINQIKNSLDTTSEKPAQISKKDINQNAKHNFINRSREAIEIVTNKNKKLKPDWGKNLNEKFSKIQEDIVQGLRNKHNFKNNEKQETQDKKSSIKFLDESNSEEMGSSDLSDFDDASEYYESYSSEIDESTEDDNLQFCDDDSDILVDYDRVNRASSQLSKKYSKIDTLGNRKTETFADYSSDELTDQNWAPKSSKTSIKRVKKSKNINEISQSDDDSSDRTTNCVQVKGNRSLGRNTKTSKLNVKLQKLPSQKYNEEDIEKYIKYVLPQNKNTLSSKQKAAIKTTARNEKDNTKEIQRGINKKLTYDNLLSKMTNRYILLNDNVTTLNTNRLEKYDMPLEHKKDKNTPIIQKLDYGKQLTSSKANLNTNSKLLNIKNNKLSNTTLKLDSLPSVLSRTFNRNSDSNILPNSTKIIEPHILTSNSANKNTTSGNICKVTPIPKASISKVSGEVSAQAEIVAQHFSANDNLKNRICENDSTTPIFQKSNQIQGLEEPRPESLSNSLTNDNSTNKVKSSENAFNPPEVIKERYEKIPLEEVKTTNSANYLSSNDNLSINRSIFRNASKPTMAHKERYQMRPLKEVKITTSPYLPSSDSSLKNDSKSTVIHKERKMKLSEEVETSNSFHYLPAHDNSHINCSIVSRESDKTGIQEMVKLATSAHHLPINDDLAVKSFTSKKVSRSKAPKIQNLKDVKPTGLVVNLRRMPTRTPTRKDTKELEAILMGNQDDQNLYANVNNMDLKNNIKPPFILQNEDLSFLLDDPRFETVVEEDTQSPPVSKSGKVKYKNRLSKDSQFETANEENLSSVSKPRNIQVKNKQVHIESVVPQVGQSNVITLLVYSNVPKISTPNLGRILPKPEGRSPEKLVPTALSPKTISNRQQVNKNRSPRKELKPVLTKAQFVSVNKNIKVPSDTILSKPSNLVPEITLKNLKETSNKNVHKRNVTKNRIDKFDIKKEKVTMDTDDKNKNKDQTRRTRSSSSSRIKPSTKGIMNTSDTEIIPKVLSNIRTSDENMKKKIVLDEIKKVRSQSQEFVTLGANTVIHRSEREILPSKKPNSRKGMQNQISPVVGKMERYANIVQKKTRKSNTELDITSVIKSRTEVEITPLKKHPSCTSIAGKSICGKSEELALKPDYSIVITNKKGNKQNEKNENKNTTPDSVLKSVKTSTPSRKSVTNVFTPNLDSDDFESSITASVLEKQPIRENLKHIGTEKKSHFVSPRPKKSIGYEDAFKMFLESSDLWDRDIQHKQSASDFEKDIDDSDWELNREPRRRTRSVSNHKEQGYDKKLVSGKLKKSVSWAEGLNVIEYIKETDSDSTDSDDSEIKFTLKKNKKEKKPRNLKRSRTNFSKVQNKSTSRQKVLNFTPKSIRRKSASITEELTNFQTNVTNKEQGRRRSSTRTEESVLLDNKPKRSRSRTSKGNNVRTINKRRSRSSVRNESYKLVVLIERSKKIDRMCQVLSKQTAETSITRLGVQLDCKEFSEIVKQTPEISRSRRSVRVGYKELLERARLSKHF